MRRNNLFDAIKMICILMIVINHMSWTTAERQMFIFPFIIGMAVPVFLIISSYLRAKKIETVGYKEFISFRYSAVSFFRLIVAYVVAAVIEGGAYVIMHDSFQEHNRIFFDSISTFILWILTGLSGPGSYYMPIMVQMILLYPLIYLLFRKGKNRGLINCFILNITYELIAYFANINPGIYRLLIFRYIFIIGFGIYLEKSSKDKKEDLIATTMFFCGVTLMTLNSYFVQFPLVQEWKNHINVVCSICVWCNVFFDEMVLKYQVPKGLCFWKSFMAYLFNTNGLLCVRRRKFSNEDYGF